MLPKITRNIPSSNKNSNFSSYSFVHVRISLSECAFLRIGNNHTACTLNYEHHELVQPWSYTCLTGMPCWRLAVQMTSYVFLRNWPHCSHTITARSCVSNQCHAVPEQQLKAKLSRRGMLAAFWSGMTVTIWLISRLYFMGFEPRALCLAYSTSAVFHLPELLRRPWGWPALTWPWGHEHLAWVVGAERARMKGREGVMCTVQRLVPSALSGLLRPLGADCHPSWNMDSNVLDFRRCPGKHETLTQCWYNVGPTS